MKEVMEARVGSWGLREENITQSSLWLHLWLHLDLPPILFSTSSASPQDATALCSRQWQLPVRRHAGDCWGWRQ